LSWVGAYVFDFVDAQVGTCWCAGRPAQAVVIQPQELISIFDAIFVSSSV
jgi:hypothetical protein